MAEVRQCFGRGAHNFAFKMCKRYLPESQNTHVQSAAYASSPSTRLLPGDIKNDGMYGAENAADRVTVGVSQDSYTRVKPLHPAFDTIWERRNVAEKYYYRGPEEYSLSSKTRGEIIERKPRSYAKFLRTSSSRQQSTCSRHLYWGRRQFAFIRAYSGNGTRSEPLYKTKTGYYDILEVSPSATQVQIKTAYYKQSFIYHPDRNAGSDDATSRFSEISEAYTVLGNKGLRKKYDRGLLSQSDLTGTARPSAKDTTGRSAKPQTGSRRSVAGADSRENMFDFDTFFKSHYGDQLQRQKDIRARKEELQKMKEGALSENKLGRMSDIGVVCMLVVAVGLLASLLR